MTLARTLATVLYTELGCHKTSLKHQILQLIYHGFLYMLKFTLLFNVFRRPRRRACHIVIVDLKVSMQ